MKTLTIKDLELDVLENRYIGLDCKIYLKDGEIIETQIDGYTYDDEPFCNYVEVKGEEVPFENIKEIEIFN
ncbi:hypothetical protein [Helcococcus kunzii]|uniref:hypothetical protein n=1 Tax=Helcococcus kunzii TaxID=40091 RepID=UPI001BB037D3|nr:hypothetical protein [Helcococcus kunzii]MCT1796206.1 hypothetical protein [Helcococcus kunzii]MCT1988939.1 hypothetical protein [Helcococcus kunzii]QUY64258.1 hypothetical protein GUI37_01480 [Helcococcus kunzii]QZO76714.1 hypothetical protein HIF96_01410 [Helcococcus kunzii]